MINKTVTDCLICENQAVLIANDFSGYQEPDKFKIFECPKCNTSFALPLIDVKNVYENIYNNAERTPGYNRYVFYQKKVKKVKNPLEYLAKSEEAYWVVKEALYRERERPGKIIEVGSGLGYLTYSLRKEGHDIVGLDISENAVFDAINNFGDYYLCEDVNNYAKNNEEKYDVVILTEVIEHIPDPVTFLRSLIKILKKGGIIIMTTPNKTFFDSYEDVVWVPDLPPVHFYWFSEKSMKYISRIIKADVSFIDFTEFYSSKESLISEDWFSLNPFFDEKGLLKKKYNKNPIFFCIFFSLVRINFIAKLIKILFGRSKSFISYKLGKKGPSMGCILKKI